MLKKISFIIAAVFIGGFAALAIAELFFRLFPGITGIYSTAHAASPAIYVQDEKRGYALLPMSTGRHCSLQGVYRVTYHINGQGLRSLKYYGEKSGRRILLLGDSMVFGMGVEDNETLAVRLEEALNNKFEVINAGVSGYSIDNEYMQLKAFAHLAPDIVLLGLCSNDVQDLSSHEWVVENGDMERVVETSRHVNAQNRFVNGPPSLYKKGTHGEWLFESCRRYSFLYNFLGTLQYRNRESVISRNNIFQADNARERELSKKGLQALLLVKKFCDEHDIKFMVFSTDREVFRMYPEIYKGLIAEKCAVFDISELYSKNADLALPKDEHWSSSGTVHVANWLGDLIDKVEGNVKVNN